MTQTFKEQMEEFHDKWFHPDSRNAKLEDNFYVWIKQFALKLLREEREWVATRLMLLGNTNDPYEGVNALGHLIYKDNPPNYNPSYVDALGRGRELDSILSHLDESIKSIEETI